MDKRFKHKEVAKKSPDDKYVYQKKYYAKNRDKLLQNIANSKKTCSVCDVEIRKISVKYHEQTQQHLTNLWMHEDTEFMKWIKDITKRMIEHQHLFRQKPSPPFRIFFD